MGLISRVSSRTYRNRTPKMLPENLNSLKVTDLKDLLRKFNLKVSGNKAELIERLENYQENKENITIEKPKSTSAKLSNSNDDTITLKFIEPIYNNLYQCDPENYGHTGCPIRPVELTVPSSENMKSIWKKYCEAENINPDHYYFNTKLDWNPFDRSDGYNHTKESDTPKSLKLVNGQIIYANYKFNGNMNYCDCCSPLIYFTYVGHDNKKKDMKFGYRVKRKGGSIHDAMAQFLQDKKINGRVENMKMFWMTMMKYVGDDDYQPSE